jgi:hypothetical protein
MTYAEKLKDPRWQKKRLEIFERDNWTCTTISCNSKDATLHVHHLDYLPNTEPWDYPDHFLVTKCEHCHKELTEFKKEYETRLLRQFRLGLQDTFIQECAAQLFEAYGDEPFSERLQNLIYILWELRKVPDSVIDLLRTIHNIKSWAHSDTYDRFKKDVDDDSTT